MSLLATVNARGLLSARPAAAAANEGYLYFATDGSGTLYRSNGASWDVNSPTGLADQGTATYLDFTTAAAPANPAAGKIRIYSKTGDTLAQRTSGGTETVFGAGGGGAAFVGVLAYNNGTQTLGAAGVLALDSEEFDTNTFHDLVTNNSRLTVPAGQGGKYQIIGHVYHSVSGAKDIYIRKNGANLRGSYITINTVSAISSVIADLVATDYIELYADIAGTYGHATDGSLQVTLSMHKLG